MEARGFEEIHEIREPFQTSHGASPCDDDVAPPESLYFLLVLRHGHEAHPVCVVAPQFLPRPRLLKEVGEIDVGGCVEILCDVVAGVGEAEVIEHGPAVVLAAPAVFGIWVEVEGVVAGLGEVSVFDELAAEEMVHRLTTRERGVLRQYLRQCLSKLSLFEMI